jgi:2-dehydro-3-deoxyphosphooctonate aldolase (KDO 8-P synthase)
MSNKVITLGNVQIGNHLPLTAIVGPCQIESRQHALETAEEILDIGKKLGIGIIYKSSFDKANRSSISGKRGIGLAKALPIFEEIKQKFNCPVITDVHSEAQCKEVAKVVDVLQIPAFLCRQTDLLLAAGETDRVINIKKGQFLAPWDMKNVAEKVASTGNSNIMLTERGASFGYNRLISDMRALPIMAETGYPVIFDATHSVQEPGGLGAASGGQRKFVAVLARAAVAAGAAGVFIESHPNPDNAPSDGPCMVALRDLEALLTELMAIDDVVKKK